MSGHHRFANGHGTDADAGIVTALGDDICLITIDVYGLTRRQDGTGRFDGLSQSARGNCRERYELVAIAASVPSQP